MGRVRYILALIEVTVMPGALLYWFSVHPFVKFWRRVGARTTVGIHLAMIAVLGVATYAMRDRVLAVDYGTNWWLIGLSTPALAVALLLSKWRGRHVKLRILMGMPELRPEGGQGQLLCEGIYARIRHPRYLEVWFALLFDALFINFLAAWVILVASVPVLLAIIGMEEKELRERFGEEYVRYCERVPRFLPRRRELG